MESDLVVGPTHLQLVDVLSQVHVGLEVVKVVVDQVGDDCILHCYLLLEDTDFILKVLDLSKLGSLDDHDITCMMHPFYGLFNLISQAVYRNINQPTVPWISAIKLNNPTPTTPTS